MKTWRTGCSGFCSNYHSYHQKLHEEESAAVEDKQTGTVLPQSPPQTPPLVFQQFELCSCFPDPSNLKSPKGITSLLSKGKDAMCLLRQIIISKNNRNQKMECFLYLPTVPLTSRKTLAKLSGSAGKHIWRISPTLPGRPGTPAAL